MKIALIGPGIMPIPPQGWGAVEIIVWHVYNEMIKRGHEVVIFNDRDLSSVCNQINSSNFDFIHSHYDEHVPFLNANLKKPFVCTSHYGWILKYKHWDHNYYDRLFKAAINAPGIFALSKNIANLFVSSGAKNFTTFLRNGTDVEAISFKDSGNNKALCLGQISTRKQQGQIARLCGDSCSIDFAGPKADDSFRDNGRCQYIGTWTKDCVNKYLTNYSCLVLLSNGEAAPLVVLEALAAGLSVVVSEAASENLDRTLPFVSVLDDNTLKINPSSVSFAINQQIDSNNNFRKDIRNYAKNHFDWSVVCKEYEQKIGEFCDYIRNTGR